MYFFVRSTELSHLAVLIQATYSKFFGEAEIYSIDKRFTIIYCALERCSAAISDWMLHNGLALNPDKSEAIMFGTSQAIASCKIKSVTAAGSAITISDRVKSLRVTNGQMPDLRQPSSGDV